MKRTKSKKEKTSSNESTFETAYRKIVAPSEPFRLISEPESFVQPTPYRVVPTYTTYGAYEDPI